jgi:type II secretory pathway component GspD/PulD (secretin)
VVLRSQPQADAEPTVQKVFVMNGERAQFQVSQSMPVQWVKSAVQQTGTTTALSGDITTTDARGVEQGMSWLDASQSLSVLPRWSGGRQPVVLQVQVEGAAPESDAPSRVQSNVPGQSRSRLTTTVLVPLGEWFTLGVSGATGTAEKSGVYTSQSSEPSAVKLLQVRVRVQ